MRRKYLSLLSLEAVGTQDADSASRVSLKAYVVNGLTIAAFLVLNATLNMTNRWVLGVYGFKFPIFLTMAHLIFGVVALGPVMALPHYAAGHVATLKNHWKGIACVGAFKVANSAAHNGSLVLISLSLNQIIRSGIPIATALLGILIEKTVPTGFEVLSLVILTAGVVFAIWEGSLAGSGSGILIAVASTFCAAAMLNFSGKVLKEDLDVLSLAFYSTPVSIVVLIPFFVATEMGPLLEFSSEANSSMILWYLLLGGINSVLFSLIFYRVVQITSSTATPVIGMVKVVAVLVLSALFLGESSIFTVRMVVGCILAILGFTMYSYASLEAHQRRTPSVHTKAGTTADAPAGAAGVESLPLMGSP